MRRLRFPPLTAWAVLALAAAALLPTARADEPDRSRWLAGRTYAKGTSFPGPGGATVEPYVASGAPAGEAESAWFRFLVLENGEVVESYAVDATRVAEQPTRLELLWEDEGPETAGVRVSAALVEEGPPWAEGARQMLATALAARTEWRAASALLAQAATASDPHAAHPLALSAYRALERIYAARSAHLGVLSDLLVADQLLVPLEVGSDRGANLAFAWREHVAHAEATAAVGVEFPQKTRTAAVCALAEGCYAQAAIALAEVAEGEDAEIDALRAGIRRLGQETQELLAPRALEGPKGKMSVSIARCTAEPVGDGLLFHRLSFFTSTPRHPDTATPVWYSLTCERTEARTRWSLYGWVGGSRRLLHLYGAEEPSGDAVIDEVIGFANQAVGGETPK